MFSFFSRHEVDKKATGFNSGEEGFPSPEESHGTYGAGMPDSLGSRKKVNRINARQ
jgi:hypothetical protein